MPCGNINIHYDNINCEDLNDDMRFRYYYTLDSNIYMYKAGWTSEFFFAGCTQGFGDDHSQIPVGNYTIEWKVTRTSTGTTYGSDAFTIAENDSTTYLIEY